MIPEKIRPAASLPAQDPRNSAFGKGRLGTLDAFPPMRGARPGGVVSKSGGFSGDFFDHADGGGRTAHDAKPAFGCGADTVCETGFLTEPGSRETSPGSGESTTIQRHPSK